MDYGQLVACGRGALGGGGSRLPRCCAIASQNREKKRLCSSGHAVEKKRRSWGIMYAENMGMGAYFDRKIKPHEN